MIRPLIATAPSESAYAELDLLDKSTVRWGSPVDLDIRTPAFHGATQLTKRAVQRRIVFDCLGLTVSDWEQLWKWKHDRTRLRPFPGYGEHTVLYHAMQRANPWDSDDIGTQIGPAPGAFTETWKTNSGNHTYVGEDGLIHLAGANVPRYQAGAFGMRGLMMTSEKYQFLPVSHPTAIWPVWSSGAGSPTFAVTNNMASIVSGLDDTMEVTAAQNESVIMAITSGAGFSYAGKLSFQIWIRGSGTIEVATTGPVASSGNVELDGSWQRIVLEDLTKVAGTWSCQVYARSTNGAVFFLGPMQLEDNYEATSYIHNVHGTNPCECYTTGVEWASPFRVPDLRGSIFLGFQHGRALTNNNVNQWIVHQENTSPNRFGVGYRGQTALENYWVQLQTSSAAWNANGTIAEGADVLLGGTWDYDEIALYINGDQKATQAVTGVQRNNDGLNLADPEINDWAHPKPLSLIRIDDVAHSEADMELESERWTDAEHRPWVVACEGRDFDITQIEGGVVPGNPSEYRGRVTLTEQNAHEESITGEPF